VAINKTVSDRLKKELFTKRGGTFDKYYIYPYENIMRQVERKLQDSNIPKIFEHKSVLFTGKLPNMPRNAAQSIARGILGAKSTPRQLCKSTDIVVEGIGGGKIKITEAKKRGVKIISAEDFMKIIKL